MFNFGLLTAILDGWNFEEAVDTAAEMGFECLEVACWPAGKAERRYAGVSHIDAATPVSATSTPSVCWKTMIMPPM